MDFTIPSMDVDNLLNHVNSCVSFVFGWGEMGREHKKGGPAYNAGQAKTMQQEK